ncbi:MAG: DUF4013 domain-containing protein [Anaerolineaceae bacterium]
MDFGKSFSYIFDDPDWFNKVIIPILFGLIPVIGWFVITGYSLRTTRNVTEQVEHPLPVCDFSKDLGKGFKFFLITLIYAVLAVVIGGLIYRVVGVLEDNPGYWLAIIGLVVFVIIFAVYILFLTLVMPAVQANYAVKGTFASAFAFKDLFKMLGNRIGAWLWVVLGGLLAGLIAPLGVVACVIGVFLTSMYAELIVAHLRGQAYYLSQPEVVIETPV